MSDASTIDPGELDWLTIEEGEEIVWSGNPHKSSLIPALVIGLPLSLILVGLFIIASAYLQRENTQYVVTSEGVYKKTGVLSRDVQRIDFGKVQNISYNQGFFGSQFGYGNVDISTAGGSGVEMQFWSVPDPREVQELINKRMKRSRGEPTTESGETTGDVLDDILLELREIRSTLEAQQEAAETSSDSTEDTSSALEEPSTDEDGTTLNEFARRGQRAEHSTATQDSDEER